MTYFVLGTVLGVKQSAVLWEFKPSLLSFPGEELRREHIILQKN